MIFPWISHLSTSEVIFFYSFTVVLRIFWVVLLNSIIFRYWYLLKCYHWLLTYFTFDQLYSVSPSLIFIFLYNLLGSSTFILLSLFLDFFCFSKSIQCILCSFFFVILTPKYFVVATSFSGLMVGFWDLFNGLLGT